MAFDILLYEDQRHVRMSNKMMKRKLKNLDNSF